jgi:hypothetical protein
MVKRLSLIPAFGDGMEKPITATWLSIRDTAPIPSPSIAGDIIAARLDSSEGLRPMKLAKANPKDGTDVWLAAPVAGGAPRTQRLHSALVTGINKGNNLMFEFDSNDLSLIGTSGGAILNSRGEVVGIQVGTVSLGKQLYGTANPVDRFRPALIEAASK